MLTHPGPDRTPDPQEPDVTDGICIIKDCTHPVKVKKYGWCSRHYQRWQLHGDPLAGRTLVGVPMEHYNSNLMTETENCKIWPFHKLTAGYGILQKDKRQQLVHVLACEAWHGPMPVPGMDAAHGVCHNPSCWNGAHLSWKTRKGNMGDQLRDGTRNKGERNGGAKVTAEVVRHIRQRLLEGASQTEIAIEVGLSQTHISAIKTRRKWAHIE